MNYEKKYLKYKKKYVQLTKKQVGGAQDIRLFIKGEWVKGTQNHIDAFNNFKKSSSDTYEFDNNLSGDKHVSFSLKRKSKFGRIYLIENDAENPIVDFDDVKIFFVNQEPIEWINAFKYFRWAYFDFIFSDNKERRYYKWDKHETPKDAIDIPTSELVSGEVSVDYSTTAFDFTMYRNTDGSIYIIRKNTDTTIFPISDNDNYRNYLEEIFKKQTNTFSSKPITPQLISQRQKLLSDIIKQSSEALSNCVVPRDDSVWFDRVFGFHEMCPNGRSRVRDELRLLCKCEKKILIDKNGKEFNVGKPECLKLNDLMKNVKPPSSSLGKLTYTEVDGNIKKFHLDKQYAGSLFQVASQFNALEMVSPEYKPEMGITIYEHDKTQGPVCAMMCPYGTLYRNYFSMPDGMPQTEQNQINTLDELVKEFNLKLLYKNGYIFPSNESESNSIERKLFLHNDYNKAKGLVKYFIQYDTPVIDDKGTPLHTVSQIYCSALPLAYNTQTPFKETFTKMILEAVYLATFACAIEISQKKNARVNVFLTKVGGGEFGNPEIYINEAIEKAKNTYNDYPIDVFMVNYSPDTDLEESQLSISPSHQPLSSTQTSSYRISVDHTPSQIPTTSVSQAKISPRLTTSVSPVKISTIPTTSVSPASTPLRPPTYVPPAMTYQRPSTYVPPVMTYQRATTSVSPAKTLQRPTTSVSPVKISTIPTTSVSQATTPQRATTSVSPAKTPQRPTTSVSPVMTYQRATTSVSPVKISTIPTTYVSQATISPRPSTYVPPVMTYQRATTSVSPAKTPQRPTTSVSPAKTPLRPTTSVSQATTPQRPPTYVPPVMTYQRATTSVPQATTPSRVTTLLPAKTPSRATTSVPQATISPRQQTTYVSQATISPRPSTYVPPVMTYQRATTSVSQATISPRQQTKSVSQATISPRPITSVTQEELSSKQPIPFITHAITSPRPITTTITRTTTYNKK